MQTLFACCFVFLYGYFFFYFVLFLFCTLKIIRVSCNTINILTIHNLKNYLVTKILITYISNITKPTQTGSAKDKEKDKAFSIPINQPQLGDAYVELECSLAVGVNAIRNDERDLQFAAARKAWDANEPGRNLRGAQIR